MKSSIFSFLVPILSFHSSSAFLFDEARNGKYPILIDNPHRMSFYSQQLLHMSGDGVRSQEVRPLRPVYVVGEPAAAMGAATALAAFQALTGRTGIPTNDYEKGNPPPPQPVALFASATDVNWEYKLKQRILSADTGSSTDDNTDAIPILHVPLEAAGILLNSIPEIRNGRSISLLGLQVGAAQESQGIISQDIAQSSADNLQLVLDNFPDGVRQGRPFAVVSLGLSLHLAMLQANCLPKSPVNQDTYHVLMPEGGSIHVNYQYKSGDPAAADPLACPTKETVISTPPTFATVKRSASSSAAYSALRGNGMDQISSAAIAAACATILGDSDHSSTSSGSITWSTIERIVQLSRHIREFGSVERPGALRTKYIEYGYK